MLFSMGLFHANYKSGDPNVPNFANVHSTEDRLTKRWSICIQSESSGMDQIFGMCSTCENN